MRRMTGGRTAAAPRDSARAASRDPSRARDAPAPPRRWRHLPAARPRVRVRRALPRCAREVTCPSMRGRFLELLGGEVGDSSIDELTKDTVESRGELVHRVADAGGRDA